eukprot:TRINITY_DN20549_c0_g1_i1.p1 TRINITY_DN20549_c0_g1~~TRINITY_DN20549_c0_g1_i1.p1  ORF type:complete len:580 (+),score=51.35 TRINITY_DN20549_c0_g1_i1:64-1803(+)
METLAQPPSGNDELRVIPAESLALHASATDCWISLRGRVYDITSFMHKHPGGVKALALRAGTDATQAFERIGHSPEADKILASLYVGELQGVNGDRADASSCQFDLERPAVVGRARDEDAVDCADERQSMVRADENEQLHAESLLRRGLREGESPPLWHSRRRAAILEKHPEVASLMKHEPRTLLVIPLLAFGHAGVCLLAQWFDSVIVAVLLAYSFGSFFKTWQFAMAHEVCHGNVTEWLETSARGKHFAMHAATLPGLGNHTHLYYEGYHLGHHAHMPAFEMYGQSPADLAQPGWIENSIDGDLFSVSTMKLLWLKVARSKLPCCQHFLDRMNRHAFFRFMVNAIFDMIWAFSVMSMTAASLWALPVVFASLFIHVFGWGAIPLFKSISDVDKSEILMLLEHCSLHAALSVMIDLVLLFGRGQSLRTAGLGFFYLLLSESFQHGFLLHPYMAFWLGTHGTGIGHFDSSAGGNEGPGRSGIEGADETTVVGFALTRLQQDCQPTMSTYSRASAFLTANLAYHVEHHDFPKCAWTRLPQITALAPEFYQHLRKSNGFRHTLSEYIKHGHDWSYGCTKSA